jgi:hypothetical protein
MIAEPHYFCLVLEVAWGNTQDIHCSVIDIAQVVILMDDVDDCLSLAWVDDGNFGEKVHEWILVDDAPERQQANGIVQF